MEVAQNMRCCEGQHAHVRSRAMSSEQQPESRVETASWGARFGWLAGGLAGLLAGFGATYAIERLVLRGTHDPIGIASKVSAVVVPGLFLVGALSGHAFGGTGSTTRYKWLGVASGVLIAVTAWAALVLMR